MVVVGFLSYFGSKIGDCLVYLSPSLLNQTLTYFALRFAVIDFVRQTVAAIDSAAVVCFVLQTAAVACSVLNTAAAVDFFLHIVVAEAFVLVAGGEAVVVAAAVAGQVTFGDFVDSLVTTPPLIVPSPFVFFLVLVSSFDLRPLHSTLYLFVEAPLYDPFLSEPSEQAITSCRLLSDEVCYY